MTHFIWNSSAVPSNLKIKQVYGIVFSDDKRILLRIISLIFFLFGFILGVWVI